MQSLLYSQFIFSNLTSSNGDLATQINAENEVKWTGKIALPTVSEFIRTNNWMNNIILTAEYGYLWTLSPVENETSIFFAYNNQNSIGFMYTESSAGSNPRDDFSIDISPVLYLSSDITLTGDGSSSNPFIITN